MLYLKLINPETKVEVELEGRCWEEILEVAYKRKRASLFEILKKKTEVLEKQNFRMGRVNYLENNYK